MENTATKELTRLTRIVLVLAMIMFNTSVNGQELRIWTHGHQSVISTGRNIFQLPYPPVDPNIRYIEFSDFVVEVSDINLYDTVLDTIRFRVEYPGELSEVAAKIARIKTEKIYYRFYIDSLPGENDNDEYAFLSDSTVQSIEHILWPANLEISDTPCLLWVDVKYDNCLLLREVVAEDMVFVNQCSDYAGSIRRKSEIKSYKLPSFSVQNDTVSH